MIAHSVQVCGNEPPLICIAATKGHRVDLLIRDSRAFALCCIPAMERLLIRRFSKHHSPESSADEQFDGIACDRLVSGAPILARSLVALDCQLFRQVDLETDHELIVGSVLAIRESDSER
jgi:flavin reductase (DIM6/NTAB) family NADH-FMN oxidoreductase RutF